MERDHRYAMRIVWTGAAAGPTTDYRSYSRDHEIRIEGKAVLPGSADPYFRGSSDRHNPEEMLVAALSTCHMMSYLAEAAFAGVLVVGYEDEATGTMRQKDRGGRFVEVTLRPKVVVAPGTDIDLAERLHHLAHEHCFIAQSVNFPVRCVAETSLA